MTSNVHRLTRFLALGAVVVGASMALPAAPASAGPSPCTRWQSCGGDGTYGGARRLAAACHASGGVAYKGPNWLEEFGVECEGSARPGKPIYV